MIRIGQKLKEERLNRGLRIEDVAKATRIKESFLAAIEKGEYKKLPSSAYAYGFVQNYIEYLKLPKKETLALFRREFDEKNIYKVMPDGFTRQKSLPLRGFRIHHTVFAVIVLFLLLIGFILFQYRYAIISPPLTVQEPTDGALTSSEITVSGRTDPNAVITVNGQPTPVSDSGEFMKNIMLFEGEETVTVVAKHRLGKETRVVRNIVVQ